MGEQAMELKSSLVADDSERRHANNNNRGRNFVILAAEVTSPALNYYRLARLTMVEGTVQVQRQVYDRLPCGVTIHSYLDQSRTKLMKSYRDRQLSEMQWSMLYPEHSTADVTKFDLTLWLFLLRKIVHHGVPVREWCKVPEPYQTEWYHDIVRIRETRNCLSHQLKPEIDDSSFESLWRDIVEALRRLDCTVDIDQYRTATFHNSEVLRTTQLQVNQQVLEEINVELREEVKRRRQCSRVIVAVSIVSVLFAFATVIYLAFQLRSVVKEDCESQVQSAEFGQCGLIRYVERSAWTNRPANVDGEDKRQMPVGTVYYSDTEGTGSCRNTNECCSRIRNIQDLHMGPPRKWSDIGYHYIIDSEGVIYFARPPDIVPAAVKYHNKDTISIAILGNYQYETPRVESLESLESVLCHVEAHGWLRKNYSMYAMCDARKVNDPGFELHTSIWKACNPVKKYARICSHIKYPSDSLCFFNYSSSSLPED